MQRLLAILNSPLGLLVAGTVISGLLVHSITSRWQQNDWLFQQRFTAERVQFEKQLEQRYKLLEDTNIAVVDVLTHSQWVVVGRQKKVSTGQQNELVRAYNDAVLKWEPSNRLYGIRLKTLFKDRELVVLWETVRKERDKLDQAIYALTATGSRSEDECIELIEGISNTSALLSQRMLTEINARQSVP
jgi:hypothetical protein